MKKVIITILLLLFSFTFVNAEDYNTNLIDIEKSGELKTSVYDFKNISLTNSNSEEYSFLLKYEPILISKYNISYNLRIDFYDSNSIYLDSEEFNDISKYEDIVIKKLSDKDKVKYYKIYINYGHEFVRKEEYSIYDYVIESYDYKANFNANNEDEKKKSFVTESVVLLHNNDKTFIRIIPKRYNFKNSDGEDVYSTLTISSVSSDNDYRLDEDDDNYYIEFTRDQTKSLVKYDYTIYYCDNIINKTRVFLPLLPAKMNNPVEKYTFSAYKDDYEYITYTFYDISEKINLLNKDNTINNFILSGEDYIYSLADINTNYIKEDKVEEDNTSKNEVKVTPNIIKYEVIALICSVVLASLSLFMLLFKKPRIKNDEMYYPVRKVSSIFFGLTVSKNSKIESVISLLFELANEGFIEIINEKNEFKFRKVKDYNGNNNEKRMFFNRLFESNDLIDKDNISSSFINTCDEIYKNTLMKVGTKNSRGFKAYRSSRKISVLVCIFSLMFFFVFKFLIFGDYDWILLFISFCLLTSFYMINLSVASKVMKLINAVALLLSLSMFGYYSYGMYNIILECNANMSYLYIDYICFIISILIALIYNKKVNSIDANIMVKKCNMFFDNATKEEILEMTKLYPNYIFDMIPYAFSVNKVKKWLDKMKDENISSPNWYKSNKGFYINMFGSEIEKMMDEFIKYIYKI